MTLRICALLFLPAIMLSFLSEAPSPDAAIRCSTGPYLIDDKAGTGEGIGTGLMSFNLGVRLALHFNITLLTDPTDKALISCQHNHTSFVHRFGLLLDKDCSTEEVVQRGMLVVNIEQGIPAHDRCSTLLRHGIGFGTHELLVKIANILDTHAASKSQLVIILSRPNKLCYCEDCGFANVTSYYQKYYSMQLSIDIQNGIYRIGDRSKESLKKHLVVAYHLRAGDVASGSFSADNLHPNMRTLPAHFAVSILTTLLENEKSVLFGSTAVTMNVFMEQSRSGYINEATAFLKERLPSVHIVFHTESYGVYDDLDRMRQSDVFIGGWSAFAALGCMLNPHSVNILDSRKFVYNQIRPNMSCSFETYLDDFNRLFCHLNKHVERHELIMQNCSRFNSV